MTSLCSKGIYHEGVFYLFGSIEFNMLLFIEGLDRKNKRKLLGAIASIELKQINRLFEYN